MKLSYLLIFCSILNLIASTACHHGSVGHFCQATRECDSGEVCSRNFCALPASGLSYASNDAVLWVGAPAVMRPSFNQGFAGSFKITPALPAGLQLDLDSGIISGTPEGPAGSGTYAIETRDGDKVETMILRIALVGPRLNYAPGGLNFVKDTALESGQPLDFDAKLSCRLHEGTQLPVGLFMDPKVPCQIAGTARDLSEARDYLIDVLHSGGVAQTAIQIEVNDGAVRAFPPSITASLPVVKTYRFGAVGGRPPYRFEILSGPGGIDDTGFYQTGGVGLTQAQVTDSLGRRGILTINNVQRTINGNVYAVAKTPAATYIGGLFSMLDYYDAPGVIALDKKSGDPKLSFDVQGAIDGYIYAMVAVGRSIYIAGEFSSYRGTLTHNLAKLDAVTGAIDPNFASPLNSDTVATALAVSGDSIFASTEPRNGPTVSEIIKIDALYGVSDSQYHAKVFDGAIRDLAVSEGFVFAAGEFTSYGGLPAKRLAKIDGATGALDANFSRPGGFDGTVYSLALQERSLFVGGAFMTYGSQPTKRLAKLDISTAALDEDFSRNVDFDDNVYSLAIDENSLFVGGQYTEGSKSSVQGIAKLDAATGARDRDFSLDLNGPVYSVAAEGKSLFVGGDFTKCGNASAQRIVKINRENLAIDADFYKSTGFDGSVEHLRVFESTVFVAGDFRAYRGTSAPKLAKFDARGVLDTTFTRPENFERDDAIVYALTVVENSVYVGGYLGEYRGAAARMMLKLDLVNGELDRNFTKGTGFDTVVLAIAASGTSLYAGGWFNTYRGDAVQKIAKLNLADGSLDKNFSKGGGFDGGSGSSVKALAISDNSLYVGGGFTKYRNQPAVKLAKLDLTNGNLDQTFTQATGFDTASNRSVASVLVSGNSLYAGGQFTSYRNQAVQNLVKIDKTTGALDTSFTQATGINYQVSSLAAFGGALYVGGYFWRYRDADAISLAKLDLTSGALDARFTQAKGFDLYVYSLIVFDNALYAGGLLRSYRDVPVQGLVKLDLTSGDRDDNFKLTAEP